MKIFVSIKSMIFEEDNIEHEIILFIDNIEFYGYDLIMNLPNDNKFIKDTLKIKYKKDKDGKDTEEIEDKKFVIREQNTWWNYPLYEIIDGEIIDFDYTKYSYFSGTDRRMALTQKVSELYNPSSEAKLIRKTIKKVLDHLEIVDDEFGKYYSKVEAIINKNPKS